MIKLGLIVNLACVSNSIAKANFAYVKWDCICTCTYRWRFTNPRTLEIVCAGANLMNHRALDFTRSLASSSVGGDDLTDFFDLQFGWPLNCGPPILIIQTPNSDSMTLIPVAAGRHWWH